MKTRVSVGKPGCRQHPHDLDGSLTLIRWNGRPLRLEITGPLQPSSAITAVPTGCVFFSLFCHWWLRYWIAVSLEPVPKSVCHGWPCQEYKAQGDIALRFINSRKPHHHCIPREDNVSLEGAPRKELTRNAHREIWWPPGPTIRWMVTDLIYSFLFHMFTLVHILGCIYPSLYIHWDYTVFSLKYLHLSFVTIFHLKFGVSHVRSPLFCIVLLYSVDTLLRPMWSRCSCSP